LRFGRNHFRAFAIARVSKHVGGADKPDYNKKLTLYRASGGRCAPGAKALMDLGFKNVASVDMKLADWKAAGHPLRATE